MNGNSSRNKFIKIFIFIATLIFIFAVSGVYWLKHLRSESRAFACTLKPGFIQIEMQLGVNRETALGIIANSGGSPLSGFDPNTKYPDIYYIKVPIGQEQTIINKLIINPSIKSVLQDQECPE